MSARARGPVVAAISSHVMRGTVGLRAIAFAVERRGGRVLSVPTVILPWHPGHGRATRLAVETLPAQLGELARHAGEVDAVLTGYFAAAAQVAAAADFIDAVRAARPDALVVVDPVTGDENGRYVPDAVADAIAARLLPRADVATPNVNELRDLGGAASLDAARALGPPAVIVTSAPAPSATPGQAERTGAWLVERGGAVCLTHRRIDGAARGTGDLFAGVFTEAAARGGNLLHALRTAAAATLAVVEGSDGEALDLAANQDAIAAPDVSATATVEIGCARLRTG